MYWLIWHDDNPKRTLAQKVAAGCARYQERFGQAPERVIVNEEDRVDLEGVPTETLPTIGRNTFWLGPVEGVWL